MFAVKYKNLLKKIFLTWQESAPRWQKIKEIINAKIKINNVYNVIPSYTWIRDFAWKYLTGETLWYLSWDLKTDYIKHFTPMWDNIKDEQWYINSNYWYLNLREQSCANGMTQYQWALHALQKDKDTRQSIIHFNQTKHQVYTKDFPCTVYMQFMIRDNKLIWCSYMRSNDIYFWFQYDIVWFSLLLQSLYLDLKETSYPDLELWYIYHNATSLHIYESFFDKTNQLINSSNEINNDFEIKLTRSFSNITMQELDTLKLETLNMIDNKAKGKDYLQVLSKIWINVNQIND